MKRVYDASDPADAHLMRGMLESHGIEAVVQGEALWAARGDLPFGPEASPSVWVAGENYERALAAIGEHERGIDEAAPERWICPECGESIDGRFAACWRCAGVEESH